MKFCFLIGHNWTKWSQSIPHQKGIMPRMCWRCTKVEYYSPHEHESTKAKTLEMTVDLQTFAEELGFYRFFDGKESMTIAEIIEVAKQSSSS